MISLACTRLRLLGDGFGDHFLPRHCPRLPPHSPFDLLPSSGSTAGGHVHDPDISNVYDSPGWRPEYPARYRAKIGAWLVLFLAPVMVMMHKFWAMHDPTAAQMNMIMFMKNVSIMGAALLIAVGFRSFQSR
jgi:hypothetical protein